MLSIASLHVDLRQDENILSFKILSDSLVKVTRSGEEQEIPARGPGETLREGDFYKPTKEVSTFGGKVYSIEFKNLTGEYFSSIFST